MSFLCSLRSAHCAAQWARSEKLNYGNHAHLLSQRRGKPRADKPQPHMLITRSLTNSRDWVKLSNAGEYQRKSLLINFGKRSQGIPFERVHQSLFHSRFYIIDSSPIVRKVSDKKAIKWTNSIIRCEIYNQVFCQRNRWILESENFVGEFVVEKNNYSSIPLLDFNADSSPIINYIQSIRGGEKKWSGQIAL